MNKDAILASVIGFGIGLLITGAVLVGPTLLPTLQKMRADMGKESTKSATAQTTPTLATSPSSNNIQTLIIDSPQDQYISNTDTITVSGKAPKGATIVVDGNVDEAVVQVSGTNSFQAKITLKEGINDVSVTSLSDSDPVNRHFAVFYTPKP